MTLGLEPTPSRGMTGRMSVLVLATLLLIVMQSVVARSWSVRVDAATLVVVFLALETQFWTGLWTALVVGYVAGLYSGVPAGLDAAVATAQFVVIRLFVARIVGSRWLMVTGIALMATAGAVAGRLVVYDAVGGGEVPWTMVVPSVPGQLLASMVLAWPVFRIMQWVLLQLTPRDERG